jgi:hypothetical protein
MLKRFVVCGVALALLVSNPGVTLAADVRPQGYLERGTMMQTDEGYVFVSDADRNAHGGRFFRLSGSDIGVFYGLGSHPSVDWLWPSHHTYSGLKEIIEASPGGLSHLNRYEDGAEYTQGFSRAGWLLMVGGIGALLGGLAYNLIPNNTREMQPVWFGATAGIGTVGLATFFFSQSLANQNEALLDQAIEAYNRDMAGKRGRIGYPTTPPGVFSPSSP